MAQPQDNGVGAGENLTLTEQELFERLGWFTQIRWLMGVFALMMLLITWGVFDVHFRSDEGDGSLEPAADAILVIFLYNAVFTFLLHVVRQRGHIGSRTIVTIALGQIICDMLAICALAHFTGGVENYFLVLILLPLVIAAELLPKALAYTVAAGAAALVNAMAWGEQQGLIPHVGAVWSGGRQGALFPGLYTDALYVLQATGALTVMMLATVFVGSAIAGRLRRREDELEDAYRQLHRVDEAKGFFMRKAGHEMRAPLAAIHSILDAVTHDAGELSGEDRRLMDRAKRRTLGLMGLVKELRRYSWLRAPEGLVRAKAVCFEELVENAIELFRQQAEGQGLRLTCHVEPVYVHGSEEMLREVVTNLVSNAIQYTPAGGRIDVELTARSGRAVLRVADTGIGVSEEARQHLFEEFYRSPEAKQHFQDGTGLGLAIIQRIVTMHEGEIDVSSRPEGGTTFSVSLPLEKPQAPPPT